MTGISIGMTGGMLVFLGSLLVTGVLFPSYIAEVGESTLEFMRTAGSSAQEIAEAEAKLPRGPVGPAVQAWVGTLATSTVAAAVLGAFLRRRQ